MTTPHPYPAYKPSGVPWLGDVPERWDVQRLKTFTADIGDLSNGRPLNESCIALEHVESWTGEIEVSSLDVSFDSQVKKFRAGDVLFGKLRPYLAKVARPSCDGYCVGEFLVLRSHNGELLSQYLEKLLRSKPVIDAVNASTFGARMPRADWHFIGNMVQALPPIAEQSAIVRYLDHADRRIRHYVIAKRKLIALLEEEKQAIINRAVTRGLDSNVRLKPSGVEWLGDVPEHWEVRRLGFLATKFGSGITPRGGATVYQEDGIPFLRSQNIHFDGLRIQNVARIAPSLHRELSGSHVEPGDVLLNITGASIGRTCSVPDDFDEGNVNQHVCIIRPNQGYLLSRFLAAYLSIPALQREIQFEQSGASREGLTLQSIRKFSVIVPPQAEQAAIVAHLVEATADIDSAIARARRQIELLEEYRTRLIADVVTGKLDVRAAAARLPEETEESREDLLPYIWAMTS